MKRSVLLVATLTLLNSGPAVLASGGQVPLGVTPTGFLMPRDSTVARTDGRVEIYSPGRVCRVVGYAAGGGADTFDLERVSVWRGDSLLYELAEPCGDGIYISDSGWLATVRPKDNPFGTRRLSLFRPDGSLAARGLVRAPHAFALASAGGAFVVAGGEETVVLTGETPGTWRLPPALHVAVSAQGEVVAIANTERVEVWRGGKRVLEFRAPEWTVRSLAVCARSSLVALATRHTVNVWNLRTSRLQFGRRAGRGEAFRQVRFIDSALAVGVQRRSGGRTEGLLLLLDARGKVLEQRSSGSRVLPTLRHRLRKSASPTGGRAPIRWPYAPFDSAYAIGNTYEEFQRYGFQTYLHPGVDLLAPPATPVFSVSQGVVKAVLTISGVWHWRIAVGDSASPDTTEGWLYAHLEKSSIAFGVGDTVHLGDYLGSLVTWPTHGFHHCHFVKVRQAGRVWTGDWDAVFNPLDVLRPNNDPSAPVFSRFRVPGGVDSVWVAFCENETDHYLSADSVYGKVDVVVRVGDHVGSPEWLCSVYELSYSVRSLQTDSVVVGPVLAAHLSHVIPHYLGTPALAHVLYKDDTILRSFGDYDNRIFYHVVTNSDGDSVLELSDAQEALDTTVLPDGSYEIVVVARDAAGNERTLRAPFRIRNREATRVLGLVGDSTWMAFTVGPSFPNPFNAETVVRGGAPDRARIQVYVFDVRGRTVRQDELRARDGRFVWRWNARGEPSGVYLAEFLCRGSSRILKLLLLR